MLEITAAPLAAAAFAPFGDVLENPEGERRRYFDDLLHDSRASARLRLWVSRIPAHGGASHLCETMERHPCGSQSFMPMQVARFLVAVAPPRPDGALDPAGLRAFFGRPGQGITYRAGTWHHGMVALDAPGLFAVLMWQDGGPQDEVFVPLAEPVRVLIPPAEARR